MCVRLSARQHKLINTYINLRTPWPKKCRMCFSHFPWIHFLIAIFRFRFSTSRQTLTWIPDTFFTALLSGRISSLRDDTGAIFIDRDPHLFGVILNYLRTRDIDLKQIDIRVLRHEAEYYNISPLIKRLILCEDLGHSSCGDVLFYGCLLPPHVPIHEGSSNQHSGSESEPRSSTSSTSSQFSTCSINNAKPGSMVRIPGLPDLNPSVPTNGAPTSRHSRNSSWDRLSYSGNGSSRTAQVINFTISVRSPIILFHLIRDGKLLLALDTLELLHLICAIHVILRLTSTTFAVMLVCSAIKTLRVVGQIHYEHRLSKRITILYR